MYILNLVPSKSVSSTPTELWNGRKSSLRHIRIWGSPAHVLKPDADKLESRTEVRVFVGYPKGTKGGLFYSPKDQKVIVSTNAQFLEEDYIMDHKPSSKVVLEELREDTSTSVPTVQDEVPQETATRVTHDTQPQTVPRRSGRVVKQPERFMFLGESSDLIPGKHEPDPRTYDEALQDIDAVS